MGRRQGEELGWRSQCDSDAVDEVTLEETESTWTGGGGARE